MHAISGTYEGEGPNTTAAIPIVPDTNAAPAGGTNAPQTAQTTADAAKKAQGKQQAVAITRRRQLRTSTESARSAVAINVAGGDQLLGNASRAVYVNSAGTLVCRLVDDTADATFTNLPIGIFPIAVAIVRQTGTTIAGNLLF